MKLTRRALCATFAAAVGAWETSRWKKLVKPELVTKGWSEILLTEGDRVTISEERLHYLRFECAVGTGYFHDGVLSFTEEHPNPLRAANPVPHKPA